MGQGQSTGPSQDIEEAQEGEACECDDGEGGTKQCTFNSNLVGTVGLYTRHFIVCDGKSEWEVKKLEKDSSTFVHAVLAAARAANEEKAETLKVTACSEPSGEGGVDIYVYPEKIKYIGLKESDIPKFIQDQFVEGRISESLKHISVDDLYLVLVCTHGYRDKRCGRAGPQVVETVQAIIDERGLHDKIKVLGSSHIGGHKYAGVVTIYPIGDWYGYVSARNVKPVIDSYLKKQKLYPELWRGRMGLEKNQQRNEAGLPPKAK